MSAVAQIRSLKAENRRLEEELNNERSRSEWLAHRCEELEMDLAANYRANKMVDDELKKHVKQLRKVQKEQDHNETQFNTLQDFVIQESKRAEVFREIAEEYQSRSRRIIHYSLITISISMAVLAYVYTFR